MLCSGEIDVVFLNTLDIKFRVFVSFSGFVYNIPNTIQMAFYDGLVARIFSNNVSIIGYWPLCLLSSLQSTDGIHDIHTV